MPVHRLYLLRHAKSDWADPAQADHDRPLAPRGQEAARRLGTHLSDAGIAPALVLCSTARRAVETVELVAPGGELHVESELYGASVSSLLVRLGRIGEDVTTVMVVGHNPTLQQLALTLAGPPRRSLHVSLAEKLVTGGLVTLTFTDAWAALGPGRAELTGYLQPRTLPPT
ncbi:histidine phosphatase family protein [Conexibacter sp. DBS9H8]|uniref:SixA phosphatase family protein n=1 Tax=Conexibacter sp. DBS9H8 TaxID=2937801 RepID=UPI00200F8747|nr:histidine phosphatase family protein [Conexibacter sp. DBS9H8]